MAKKHQQIYDPNTLHQIGDLLKLQNDLNTDIENDIYGTTSTGDDSATITKKKIANLMTDYKTSLNGNFFSSIRNSYKDFSKTEQQKLESIKSAIENNRNISMFQSILNNTDSLCSKYEDLQLVSSIMPSLKQAKRAIVNSILSPDDFTKQIALNFQVDQQDLSIVDPNLYKKINEILKSNKITKVIKKAVESSVTFGKYYIAVLPYSELYGELLRRKKQGNGSMNNTLVRGLYSETTDFVSLLSEASVLGEVKDKNVFINNVKTLMENVTITNEASRLFDDEIILEKASGTKSTSIFDIEKLQKDASKLRNKKNIKNAPAYADGMISTDEIKDPNVQGCKIKYLDPRRLIDLSPDEDTHLGYYYIETNEAKNRIRQNGLLNFNGSLTNKNTQASVDKIYKNIGDLLWKKLDHKFIENHPEIKEQMYEVLKYADVNEDSKLNIIFIQPENVVEYKINNGESVFEPSLLFSRLYLMLLLSTITAKAVRSNDVRAYSVDVDSSGGVNSMVYNAMNTLQQSNRSVLSSNNVSKLISNFSVFEDIFIPKVDDRKTMDFDIISGQQIDTNTDLMEMLEQICVNSSGVPLQLIQNSNEVDFARTYTMLNIKFMREILDHQIDLNPSIRDTVIKVLKTEVSGDDELATIDKLDCYLQSPMNLLLTNALEQMNNARDISQTITDLVAGNNGSETYGDLVMDQFMFEVCKRYCPNVPLQEFKQLIEELKLKNKNLDDTSEEGV